MTLVVNMVAGPGSGKSTTAAGVFYNLKRAGVNAELVTEYAKDVVWEKSTNKLGNQVYILGKQHHRLWRLKDQVDVIVTDSPLLLSLYYGGEKSLPFRDLVLELFGSFDNDVYFIERAKKYNPAGRNQTEDEARKIDSALKAVLDKYAIRYAEVIGDEHAATTITNVTLARLMISAPNPRS